MSSIRPKQISLILDLSFSDGITTSPISRARVRRVILACLSIKAKLLKNGAVINLRLCDMKEAKALNRTHRDKTYAPNVLTFEYPKRPGAPLQADIAICIPVVQKEASKQGKSLEHHFIHLLVHGSLHALGYDHQNESEAEVMEDIERTILKRFKIQDPYNDAK